MPATDAPSTRVDAHRCWHYGPPMLNTAKLVNNALFAQWLCTCRSVGKVSLVGGGGLAGVTKKDAWERYGGANVS